MFWTYYDLDGAGGDFRPWDYGCLAFIFLRDTALHSIIDSTARYIFKLMRHLLRVEYYHICVLSLQFVIMTYHHRLRSDIQHYRLLIFFCIVTTPL